MDTLIYLRSIGDLAMYDEFELVTFTNNHNACYSVFGVAGKRRDSLGDFVTRRYAVLFVDLCKSARDLRRSMKNVQAQGRASHASF